MGRSACLLSAPGMEPQEGKAAVRDSRGRELGESGSGVLYRSGGRACSFCFQTGKLQSLVTLHRKISTNSVFLNFCMWKKASPRPFCGLSKTRSLSLSPQVSSVYEARCTAEQDAGAQPNGFHRTPRCSAGSAAEDSGSEGGGEWADPGAEALFSRTHL